MGITGLLFRFLLFVEFGNTAVYFGIKLGTLDLAKDGSVIVLVDGKGLSIVGEDKFVHIVFCKSTRMLFVDNAKVICWCAVSLHIKQSKHYFFPNSF